MGVADITQPGTVKWIYAFWKRLKAALLQHALPEPKRSVLNDGLQSTGMPMKNGGGLTNDVPFA